MALVIAELDGYNNGVQLYDTNGQLLTIQSGSAIPSNPNGLMIVGTDGTDARLLKTDSSGLLQIGVPGSVAVTGTFWQTTQPVSIAATVNIAGTVTANAGTNLNTSALALESGGHLASIDTKVVLPAALDGNGYLKVHEQGVAQIAGAHALNPALATWNASTPLSTAIVVYSGTGQYNTVGLTFLQTGSTFAAGIIQFQGSKDGTNWQAILGVDHIANVQVSQFNLAPGTRSFVLDTGEWDYVQIVLTQAITGTGSPQVVIQSVADSLPNASSTQVYGSVSIGNIPGAGSPGTGIPGSALLMGASDSGTMRAVSADSTGKLNVNVSNTPTVTANAGTNLNTSALALESGGHLASIDTKVATAAKQPALGTAGSASADVITVQGIASMTALKVDGSAVTQPVSGTITANQGTSPWVSNISQFGGNNVVTGTGASGSGIPRVTVANDSSILAVQSGTWTMARSWNLASGSDSVTIVPSGTQTISGTVTANAGTNLNTSLLALESGGNLANIATHQTDGTQKTKLVDGAGTVIGPAVALGGTNYAPVTLAASATPGAAVVSRSVQIAGSDGTNAQTIAVDTNGQIKLASAGTTGSAVPSRAIQIGGTDGANLRALKVNSDGSAMIRQQDASGNVMPAGDAAARAIFVQQAAPTSGGYLAYSALSANNVTGVSIKGSAGQVAGWSIVNTNANPRYVRLYNKATAPTTSDTSLIVVRIVVPGNTVAAGNNFSLPPGFSFSSGIGIITTTGVADNDTGAPAANEVIVNVFYA